MIYRHASCRIEKALMVMKYKPRKDTDYPKASPRLVAAAHALDGTCRQVRCDFRPLLATADRQHAQGLVWRVKHFRLSNIDKVLRN